MSHLFQRRQADGRYSFFQGYGPTWCAVLNTEARLVEGGLWIQTIVNQRHSHLHMALRLHEPAHDAIAGP
jgi:hypothetical protein